MDDLLQIVKATSVKPRVTFQPGGVATDLDAGVPTVTITRPDGATIASGAVSHVGAAGSGTYEFTLSSTNTATETFLTVTWAGPIGGITQTLTTYVEVLGSLLFGIADLRALKVAGATPFSDTAAFPDDRLFDARAATLDEFEQILGFSPVPRFARETLDGDGSTCLNLPGLRAHRVLSVTVNGTAQTVGDYQINRSNQIESVTNFSYGTPFIWGRRNVTVEYVHGWTRVAGKGGNIALLHAATILQPGLSSTTSSVATPDGTVYSFDPAGQVTQAGTVRHSGVPVIDAWLHRYSQAGAVAA